MKKAFLTALTLAVTLSSLSTPALAAKAPPPALTTITTDQNAETFTNSDPNRLVLGDGFGGQGRVIFDYATGELTFDHCNLDKMLGYHEIKVQGRHISGVDPKCQATPIVDLSVTFPFTASNPETLNIPVTWNPGVMPDPVTTSRSTYVYDSTQTITNYNGYNLKSYNSASAAYHASGLTESTGEVSMGFPVIKDNVPVSFKYPLAISEVNSFNGEMYTEVPYHGYRYDNYGNKILFSSPLSSNSNISNDQLLVGCTREYCYGNTDVPFEILYTSIYHDSQYNGGVMASVPVARNDTFKMELYANQFSPQYSNADEASEDNMLYGGIQVDSKTHSLVLPSVSPTLKYYTEKLYSSSIHYFLPEITNLSVQLTKAELDQMFKQNSSMPGSSTKTFHIPLDKGLRPLTSFNDLPYAEHMLRYTQYYRWSCDDHSRDIDKGRVYFPLSCIHNGKVAYDYVHEHRCSDCYVPLSRSTSPAGPSLKVQRFADFNAYLRYIPRDAAPVAYHPYATFADTRDSTIKSVVFKGCASTISFPRTDTKTVSGYTDTANIWGWMNDVPVTIEGGKYETVNLPAALVTSGNFNSASKFITDGDSTSETANGRTTVKLTNPPIIIDWGEFPGLDIDLSAPTIFLTGSGGGYTMQSKTLRRYAVTATRQNEIAR